MYVTRAFNTHVQMNFHFKVTYRTKMFYFPDHLCNTEIPISGPKGVGSLSYVFTGPAPAALPDALPTSLWLSTLGCTRNPLPAEAPPFLGLSLMTEKEHRRIRKASSQQQVATSGDPKRGDRYRAVAMLPPHPAHLPKSREPGVTCKRTMWTLPSCLSRRKTVKFCATQPSLVLLGESYRTAR